MPQSINCVCAGEASSKLGCLLSLSENTELFGNIWIQNSEWRYVSVGGERNCKQMFGEKNTQKNHYLNVNSVYVTILLYGHSENV